LDKKRRKTRKGCKWKKRRQGRREDLRVEEKGKIRINERRGQRGEEKIWEKRKKGKLGDMAVKEKGKKRKKK
jgi:hypothetical protein